MTIRRSRHAAKTLVWLLVFSAACCAQNQVRLVTPGQNVTGGFAERFGVHWGAQQWGPQGGWFFNSGGPAGPPFGGVDPGSQASFQWAGQRGNFTWGFGITAGQGSTQSLSAQTPSITLPNGGTGFFSNSIQTPFVTGFVPIVGAGYRSPVRERWQRLQYERALAPIRQRDDNRGDGEMPRTATDPKASTARRQIDPPLILGKP